MQHLALVDVGAHFKALAGGEAVPHQLLQGLLELGVALVAQGGGEAHHGALTDAHVFAQTGGGHEGGLVVVGDDAFGDAAVAFGELASALVQALDQLLGIFHG